MLFLCDKSFDKRPNIREVTKVWDMRKMDSCWHFSLTAWRKSQVIFINRVIYIFSHKYGKNLSSKETTHAQTKHQESSTCLQALRERNVGPSPQVTDPFHPLSLMCNKYVSRCGTMCIWNCACAHVEKEKWFEHSRWYSRNGKVLKSDRNGNLVFRVIWGDIWCFHSCDQSLCFWSRTKENVKNSIPGGFIGATNMAAVPLFMAAVRSRANTIMNEMASKCRACSFVCRG